MMSTYLSFMVCNELFAVNVSKVLEVLQKQHITRVPNAPSYITGIINFRGEVVPVFESRKKFNLPERDKELPYVIIVLDLSMDTDVFLIGAMVDWVRDVITIDDADIKPVPTMSKDFKADFLNGIYKQQNDFIMILNVEKVFTGDELDLLKQEHIFEESV
jgi:purine-binding chemotaxis protein CheW